MSVYGAFRLNETFLDLFFLNLLLAYAAYYALLGGGFVVLFAGFAGIGAYATSGIIVHANGTLTEALIVAPVICALAGALFALPLRYLGGIFLGIASFTLVSLGQTVEVNWTKFTNGELGLALPVAAHVGTHLLVVIGLCLVIATALIQNSMLGTLIKTRRVDPLLASSLGVNTALMWYALVVISCAIAGLSGGLQAGWFGFVTPDTFSFTLTVTVIASVFLGGNSHWLGPAIGAFFFTALPEALQTHGDWYNVVTGASLLVIVLIAPSGIAGNIRRTVIRLVARRRSERLLAGQGEPLQSKSATPDENRPASVAALEAHDIVWSVAGLEVLRGVSINVASGEICGLVGPNGSGKTTLLNILSGVTRALSGRVELNGEDITGRAPHEIARRRLARTFQGVRVAEDEIVLTNVRTGAWRYAPDRNLYGVFARTPGSFKASRRVRDAAMHALTRAGAGEFAAWLTADCSYGTLRKVELARALVAQPTVLLLDEPTSGVSLDHISLMKRLILEESSRGCAILIVDHDLDVISEICDRVLVLDAGNIIYDGPTQEAFADPRVQEAYVGA